MIPIFLSNEGGREGYHIRNFAADFSKICRSHRAHNRALAFAFILYDFNNAHTVKVLNDDDYWRALNKLSGRFLTVFSFHTKDRNSIHVRHGGKSMARVSDSDQDDERGSRFISRTFEPGVLSRLPILLFFQVDESERVNEYFVVNFDDDGKEAVFNEIRSVLSDAVDSVSKVEPQFRENTSEIFELIRQRLQQRRGLKIISAIAKRITDVRSLFGA
jgi:hypothetical protein